MNIETETVNFEKVRQDFPILNQTINGRPLVYIDNAATTQKPQQVIDAICHYYQYDNSNVHRGVHALSQKATDEYEAAREKARLFLNASDAREIVFTNSATDAINLVAESFGQAFIQEGDEIIISAMEHHSNIVPWQMLCEKTGAKLKITPIDYKGELLLPEFTQLLTSKTKLVAITHVSNVLGTINPITKITALSHDVGAKVLIDGAQAVPHMPIDVQTLNCDFYVLSGHKMYGPTGIGILYGKYELLDTIPPYRGGGSMITRVSFEKTEYAKPPMKFEAGTPNIVGAVGMGTAMDYLTNIGLGNIVTYENTLLRYLENKLNTISGLKIIGNAKQKTAAISFVMEDVHPHDIGTILDADGVAVRAGHHCAMPLMQRFDVPATVRASFGIYNNFADIDRLLEGLNKVQEIFAI